MVVWAWFQDFGFEKQICNRGVLGVDMGECSSKSSTSSFLSKKSKQ